MIISCLNLFKGHANSIHAEARQTNKEATVIPGTFKLITAQIMIVNNGFYTAQVTTIIHDHLTIGSMRDRD